MVEISLPSRPRGCASYFNWRIFLGATGDALLLEQRAKAVYGRTALSAVRRWMWNCAGE